MTQYPFHLIQKLAASLEKAKVDPEIVAQIMEGGEDIGKDASLEDKAAWMKTAMIRMNQFMDPEFRHAIREDCACCLGGKRLQMSKSIAREHETLEDRIAAANETRFVFGHSVTRENDGRILVRFAPDNQKENSCVCLKKAVPPVPATYCYCCGGHIKHHLQIALGRKLKCTVRTTALTSAGRNPCSFYFEIEEETAG